MAVTLTVIEGPHTGAVFRFTEHDTFLVGRSPGAHFSLPEKDRYFSRWHLLIEVNPPLCRLVDLKSHNGTYLNGRRVQTADLRDGDVIKAGHSVLRFALDDPKPEGAAAAGGPRPENLAASLSHSAPTRHQPDVVPGGPPTPAADWPRLPGYEVLDELGRGGMGVVYRARNLDDGSLAAVKTVLPAVPPTLEAVARFLREVNILQSLHHPHIVAYRDMGEADGLLFFVMDLVPGIDAHQLVRAEGPLAPDRAVRLIGQVLDALAYAHGRGLVHRDIKPANVLVMQEAGEEVVKLVDFGLARVYHASQLSGLTVTGTRGGTPAFMPPEQVLDFRRVQPSADQYAAAATLYWLLSGQPLYDGALSRLELLARIVQTDPVPLEQRRPDLPRELAAVVMRALARQAADRFADIAAFRQALTHAP
jgi:eukaryotic-like serine/threonine-protein kinase